jgi:hypothetical protein
MRIGFRTITPFVSARSFLILGALVSACGGRDPMGVPATLDDTGPAVPPEGSYQLFDSTVASGARVSGAGSISFARDDRYVWTMGSRRRAGRWSGNPEELLVIDTLSSFVGVWFGRATTSSLTIRAPNEQVTYRFYKAK